MVLILILLVGLTLVRTYRFGTEPRSVARVSGNLFPGSGHVERLAKALTFPTISHHDRSAMDWSAFQAFQDYIKESFPRVHATLRLETVNDYGLVYTWPGQEPALKPILLMAHQDVVPVLEGTDQMWSHPPFGGVVADGFIWGRGALDDKASLMGILESVEALIEEGFIPKRTIYLAFGQDEEVGGEFGAQAIAHKLESQNEELELVLDEGGVIVEGETFGLDGLIALVGIAEKGYVSLKLEAESTGGHSSMPPAHTAVGKVSRAVTRLENNPFPADLQYVTMMMSGMGSGLPFMKRLLFANQWFSGPIIETVASKSNSSNAMIRTTTAATMFSGSTKDNVLPVNASAIVNFRIMPGENRDSVRARVIDTIDDPDVKVDFYGWTTDPSPVSKTDSAAFELLESAIHQAIGEKKMTVTPYITVGGTDSRFFTNLSPNVYRFLFDVLAQEDVEKIHGTNERVSLENYQQIVSFYYIFIKRAQEL